MTLSLVKLDFDLYFPRWGNSDCNVIICLYNFVFKLIFADVENRKALPDRYAEGVVEPSIHQLGAVYMIWGNSHQRRFTLVAAPERKFC